MYTHKLRDIEEQGKEFCFRKLEFDTIYNAYLNKSQLKYHIIILGGVKVWCHAYFAYLVVGGPEFGIIYLYITYTLPLGHCPNFFRNIKIFKAGGAIGQSEAITYNGNVFAFKATKTYQWTLETQELSPIRSMLVIGPSTDNTWPYDWTI